MFTGQGASLVRRRLLRFWSMTLSAVLAITLLQVAPPAKATEPLFVDLVTRADDVVGGQSVLLGETQLLQTSPALIYRLDIVPECGLLDHIGDIPVDGITDIMGSPISWSAQPENGNFVGTPEELELVLDNLRIIRKTGDSGYIDCPTSRVLAYLVEEIQWLGNGIPQGTATYVIDDSSYLLPTLTTLDSNFDFLKTSRLKTYSNGFEIEWDQFEGSTGYTPAGYSVRYREVFDGQTQRGPWIYLRSDDGRLKSLVVQDPVFQGPAPAFQYEVEVAPSVTDCDSNRLFGKFESVPFVGGFSLDNRPEASLAPANSQMITGEVVSQCLSACVPTETIAFDGEKLGTILEFASTAACTWTVPSSFTSGTLSAYVVGGGGGGGAAGGGGGGAGGFETSIDLPIAIGDTWTVRVGAGGAGSDLLATRGQSGTSSSVTHPGSNGQETITALGGGGGGSKDQSGENSGGDGIYTGETLKLSFGGAGFGSQGTEGVSGATVGNKYYGHGGIGGNGSASGSNFVEGVFASGGGGGAVCSSIDELNYPGGTSENGGSGGYCGGNSQPGSRDGNDATANSGSGGGGGASDADGNDGAGGDGGSGVIYIVHTEAPIARYLPSSCIVDLSGNCASWENTTSLDPSFTATVTGAPVVTSTSSTPLNGSTLQSAIPVVQGTPSDSIVFPVQMSNDYTFFSVARYNKVDSGQYGRIFDGVGNNWFSGFHNEVSGIAYHGDISEGGGGYVGGDASTTSRHGFNWVLSTDSKSMYRSNGVLRENVTPVMGSAPIRVAINGGEFGSQNVAPQTSDFQVADILFFNRELSEKEYVAVEDYLSEEYGICLGTCLPPVFDTTSPLLDGDYDIEYSQTITATSPYGNPINYSVVVGELPTGLSLDATTGTLSGAPMTTGTYPFTVEATDTVTGETAQQEFTIIVNEPLSPPGPPVFDTASLLPDGESGTAYSQTITATSPDGNSISYSVIDTVNFPDGLIFDTTSGVISGTPTTTGEYTFTVEATDGVNGENTRQDFTITINDPTPPSPPAELSTQIIEGGATWSGVGTGISGVVTANGASPYDSGSTQSYWLPNFDPTDPGNSAGRFPIVCPEADSNTSSNLGSTNLYCANTSVTSSITGGINRIFAASDPWQQSEVTLIAPEPTSGHIAYHLDLGFGSATQIEMTSDGDLLLENSDAWFITAGAENSNDPVLIHYFGHTDGQVIWQDPSAIDQFWIIKPITLDSALNDAFAKTQRFIEGVVDTTHTQSESIFIAMKAADQLEFGEYDADGSERQNISDVNLRDVISDDRDLPSLRVRFECRDFGKGAIHPVVVQGDGKPIGCEIGLGTNGQSEGDGPDSSGAEINFDLFPSSAQLPDKKQDWIRTFSEEFPNAEPRLGWACNSCVITSDGPVVFSQVTPPDGLPLGFTTNIEGQGDYDRIRIMPQGVVQLHASGDSATELDGQFISAFGNLSLGNEIIQGPWDRLPDYDFFYWGRTLYQGKVAFVITWVKIPTLDIGIPIDGTPSTMQLILASDSTMDDFDDYISASPDSRGVSNVDIIWNFDSIQGENAVPLYTIEPFTSPQDQGAEPVENPGGGLYSGLFSSSSNTTWLISDDYITGESTQPVGVARNSTVEDPGCNSTCVASALVANRLHSPVSGRYVLGYRDYETIQGGPPLAGFYAPASPSNVTVDRSDPEVASISWTPPVPWILQNFRGVANLDEETVPAYAYRIEYASVGRGEGELTHFPNQNSIPLFSGDGGPLKAMLEELYSQNEITADDLVGDLTVTEGPNGQRLSIDIPNLLPNENYTFRVYATYLGLDVPILGNFPEGQEDWYWNNEVRSVPVTAYEEHESELDILPISSNSNPMAAGALPIASQIAGDLTITNATINGAPYAYGETAKSVATFTGGAGSIGFDQGLVISPLTDARTFQRGSGINVMSSSSDALNVFYAPGHRAKYEQLVEDFEQFTQTQESWIPESSGNPESGYQPVCRNLMGPQCVYGTTILQFDVPKSSDYLKFDYVLAGLENTASDLEMNSTPEVYAFPDGFGLFIGDINQANSCAVVPQIGNEEDSQRFMSMGNALNTRVATEVEFDSDLNAESVTSVMSCVFDVSQVQSETVTVTMAISNARDPILSTAVFLKANSIRFEETSIILDEIPSGQVFQPYVGKQFSTTGTTPSSWSATGLPLGMELSTTGNLTGTPQVAGSYSFEITAVDENDQVLATQPFTIRIDDVERGSEVSNVRISLTGTELITWEHPLGSPEGMLYDVYFRAESDQEYEFATRRACVVVGDNGCDQFGNIPVQGITATQVALRDSYDANTNYQFKIVARWPDDETLSETVVTATSWRDVCSGENSCSYTQSGRITNEAFWEEISYEIDEAQTIQGNEDAFDGALNVYIGEGDVSDAHRVSCDFSTSELIRSDDEQIIGHEIVCSDDFYEDLEIKLSRYFFADHQWARTMIEVTNNDQSSPFTGTVWLVSNLGSDSDTFYESTSTSSGLPPQTGIVPGENGDTWAVTSDARDDFDPVLIHMLGDIKDEDYSNLACSATDTDFQPEDRTRNSNGCGNTVTGHQISVTGGATIKKAWFTGLVGYTDGLLFQNAKNRAIAAAGDFNSDENAWTGDMSGFVVPSLFYEIPELTCESVGGGRAPVEESALSVVLLNKQLETPNEESNQTNLSSASALATQLCNSVHLSTTIFDGGNGSRADWEEVLANANVLVLPESETQLIGSDLLQISGMDYLEEWVRDSGRIVMVGASNYRTELENIIGIPAGTLQVGEWESGVPVPNSNATDVLGSSLPVANGNLSKNMLKFDGPFYDAINLANVNATSLYGGSTDASYLSAVTKFDIGRGRASHLSSNFEGEPNVSWNEILLQSVYGTETSGLDISESGKNWNLWRAGVNWSEMNPAAGFKLGSIWESTSLTCMNTPASPAIRKVSAEGTEIICGRQFVQDGLVDAGVSTQLRRFVTISGDWMSSSIVVTNQDLNDTYENQLWFGGSQNLSSSMRVEGTSLSPNGTTNLSGEPNNDGSSNWIVASAGAGIDSVYGGQSSEIITHVFDPKPNAHHGGTDRASWLRGEDEIQSDWWIYLESDQSITISALTGRMSYEPGCDRTAVEISKQAARTITESEMLISLPSLAIECESFSATTSSISAQNSGASVSVSWNPVPTASHYEISYRFESSGDWSSPTLISANADSVMSTSISGLNRSTDYEFKVRAKRVSYGIHGDSATGPWADNVAAVRTSAAVVPQPPSESQPPVISNPGPDLTATIVPQMLAQTGPGLPARLKRGKTVKFGMTAPSGLPLRVSSVGKCKTSKITKKVTVKVLVGKKVKKKKVTVQTGWAVKATKKKGLCTVTFSNSGDATRSPLAAAGTITVF